MKGAVEALAELIKEMLTAYGMKEELPLYLTNTILAVIIAVISVAVYLIAKKAALKILKAFLARSKVLWGDALLKNKVFECLMRVIPVSVIHILAPVFPSHEVWIQRIAFCVIIFIVLLTLDKLLDAIDDIYRNYEVSKIRSIKGYLQVLKIASYAVGIIVIISVLIERSPLLLLSGVGAATAVLLLIFQNSILGFVAGIQLTANDMVRLGDWIEMPKYGANGDVLEITLHTVKVQNWDRTITTIPTHALVAESFKNWRGMQESGGRRIKRAIYIDMTSIKFCNEEMLQRYNAIGYIQKYVEHKRAEIEAHNNAQEIDTSNVANGRKLTNIGTFRAYIAHYLANHPHVHKHMIQLVRQLDPTANGLPIEIYVFAAKTAWVDYEAIQADIFDHILAVVPEFDLRIFQHPTGYDLKSMNTGSLVSTTD